MFEWRTCSMGVAMWALLIVAGGVPEVWADEVAAEEVVVAEEEVVVPPEDDGQAAGGGWREWLGPDNPLTRGKVIFNARLRYEFASQGGVSNANAATARIRLGYQTDWWHGFSLLVEAEATGGINQDHNYRIPGLPNQPNKVVVADPNNAEINRANLQYKNDDWGVKANLYRQRIILGNSRWVGNVGWRQNEQTFDGIRVDYAPQEYLPDFSILYAYLWQTNRIFGLWSGRDVSGGAAGKWISGSHIMNAVYTGFDWANFTLYYYGFDDKSPGPLGSNSNNIGGYLQGGQKLSEKWGVNYWAEYDYQSSGFDNPTDYNANYFHVIGGATYDIFNFAGAIEWSGADNGFAVQFPYGTNHKFGGFADLFLVTPTFGNTGGRAAGLRDMYFSAGVKIPVIDWPFKVIYHKFWSDEGPVSDLGQEVDFVAPKKIGENILLLLKGGYYWGAASGSGATPVRPDTARFWAEINYKF